MLTCRLCDCICDPGDLRNGVCDDCRAKQEREQERKQQIERLLKADYRQIEMEEMLNEKV